jgi:hypothetical protein
MSFFKFIFGKTKKNPEESKGIDEYLDYINSLRVPAIALTKCDDNTFRVSNKMKYI